MIKINSIKATIAWILQNMLAVKRLFLIAGAIAMVALFLAVGVTVVLLAFSDGGQLVGHEFVELPSDDESDDGDSDIFFAIEIDRSDEDDDDDGSLLRPPARTNFLLIGLDNQLLADALMIGTFYRDSGDVHLMSVPRDMVVRIPAHRMERMRADGLSPPQTLKVNEMRAFGGRVHGIHYLQEQLEEMLGIDFHFYVEVEIPAFRRIVDAIGGVEMYIPRRLFYESLDQVPPLRIDVPAGLQLLDGNMAEGVVRYRQWPMGDLQRNEMQMQFMTLLIQQATTREALLNDPMEIIRTILTYVRSDVGVYAIRYIPFITNVNTESVKSFTMPGTIGYVGNREFFIPDTARLHETLSDVFFAPIYEATSQPDES